MLMVTSVYQKEKREVNTKQSMKESITDMDTQEVASSGESSPGGRAPVFPRQQMSKAREAEETDSFPARAFRSSTRICVIALRKLSRVSLSLRSQQEM